MSPTESRKPTFRYPLSLKEFNWPPHQIPIFLQWSQCDRQSNKKPAVFEAGKEYVIGCFPSSDIVVTRPGIDDRHVILKVLMLSRP
jgi:hypothetical protein